MTATATASSETVGGVTTSYLVDTANPTGYAQVVDEVQSGTVTRTYAYGLERISENQKISSAWTPSFYGYDGHGSVRQLTNTAGAVTDTYDHDAFGNLVSSTGTTPNVYLLRVKPTTVPSVSTTTAPDTSTPPPAGSGAWIRIKATSGAQQLSIDTPTLGIIRPTSSIPVVWTAT